MNTNQAYPRFARIFARYAGSCGVCEADFSAGAKIGFNASDDRRTICERCIVEGDSQNAADQEPAKRFVATAKRTGENTAEVSGCRKNQVAGIVLRDLGVEVKTLRARYFPAVGGCAARFDCWLVTI